MKIGALVSCVNESLVIVSCIFTIYWYWYASRNAGHYSYDKTLIEELSYMTVVKVILFFNTGLVANWRKNSWKLPFVTLGFKNFFYSERLSIILKWVLHFEFNTDVTIQMNIF